LPVCGNDAKALKSR